MAIKRHIIQRTICHSTRRMGKMQLCSVFTRDAGFSIATGKVPHFIVFMDCDLVCSLFGDTWVFNTVTFEWKRIDVAGVCPSAREMATGTMLDASRMLIFGGRGADASVLHDMIILDMGQVSWRCHTQHAFARCAHSAAFLPRHSVADVRFVLLCNANVFHMQRGVYTVLAA